MSDYSMSDSSGYDSSQSDSSQSDSSRSGSSGYDSSGVPPPPSGSMGSSEGSGSSSSSSANNPFGSLRVTYQWFVATDLDTRTDFVGGSVGYGLGSSTDYMEWTGDETGESESEFFEIVRIDLATAWEDNEIEDVAIIELYADWYPLHSNDSPPPTYNSGTGGFTLSVNYEVDGEVIMAEEETSIPHPGGYSDTMPSDDPGTGITPAGTYIGTIYVYKDGTIDFESA